VNAKLKEVSDRVDTLQEKVDANTGGLEEVSKKMDTVEKKVEQAEKTVTDVEKNIEEGMYEEMRAREAIRRNIVMYGVKEPDQSITDGKERVEADKEECEKIFIAAKYWIGQKSSGTRPTRMLGLDRTRHGNRNKQKPD
jgi:chromosome segregation ATPase